MAAFELNESWLALRTEEAIEPELPIVDPHHHLWDGAQPYRLANLRADTGAGHNVVATVFVDCMWDYRREGPEALRPVGETERATAEAALSAESDGATIGGVVSYADLRLGDEVGEVLDAHIEAGDGLFRGIRHATALDPDRRIPRSHTKPTAGLMGEAVFRTGARQLASRNLTFDAWLYHPQIPELTAFARDVPELAIILDHIGGPLGIGPFAGHRDEIMAQWRIDLAELATCPNVVVKVGGIGMVTYGSGFDERPEPPSSDDLVAEWGDALTFVIEQFGVERCMFESNFPVDKQSCSYVVLWNAFKKIAAGCGPTEKAALFHDTAARTYSVATSA